MLLLVSVWVTKLGEQEAVSAAVLGIFDVVLRYCYACTCGHDADQYSTPIFRVSHDFKTNITTFQVEWGHRRRGIPI